MYQKKILKAYSPELRLKVEHPIFSINFLKCFAPVKKRSRKLDISIKP